eukprot:m.73258 g.73258  ORF g.73258 m.73258 type:complete len:52 (+) comp35834_c0_seq2:1288-1443(+)
MVSLVVLYDLLALAVSQRRILVDEGYLVELSTASYLFHSKTKVYTCLQLAA